MSLRINHNSTALSTYSHLNSTSSRMEKSIGKLSSGMRINSAADDAAGLAISEKMRSQISGLNRAKLNAQDGVSMIQTAEGGLNETESIIQRMRELALQASNDTLTSNDRLEIQKEINQLSNAIDDIANSTEFNTKKLLNGSQTASITSSSTSVSGMVTGNAASGGDFSVSMTVLQGGISQMQTSQMFMNKNTGELAKGSTKLEDISQFYDEAGSFALASAQTLTVTGNAKSAEVTVDGKMTLNELASALQNAIAGSSGLGMKNSSAQFVPSTGTTGQGGYFQITSGVVGEEGNFSIAGDQQMIDALGMAVSRQSVNNLVQAKIQDASGNSRTVNTSSDRLAGLLDGIDVQFDSSAAQIAGNGGIVDGMHFTGAETLTFKFSVGSVVQTVNVAFAADSNYSMEGIANAINEAIEGAVPNTGMEATVVDGQIRLAYNPTDTTSPTEIEITAGSDNLGFNTGTFSGFVDGDKNMDNARKGISLLVGTANTGVDLGFTLNGATITVGTTLTTGADLVLADDFTKAANANLAAIATANARVDIVNGSIALTSTILGKDNVSGNPSKLVLTMNDTTGYANEAIGLKDAIAKGDGDTNFRLHVVDNSSTLQIGANQGQQMTFSIGDMTAKALDIDKLDMSTTEGAQDAIGKLDNALGKVSAERSKLGAFANRLDYTMSNLENAATNLTDAESRIRDVDMASEMINFTSSQILQQAGTSMLAQANSMSQSVLSLLQ